MTIAVYHHKGQADHLTIVRPAGDDPSTGVVIIRDVDGPGPERAECASAIEAWPTGGAS